MNFVIDNAKVFFTRILSYFLMLCVSIYIARSMGPEAKGIYSLLYNTIALSVFFALLGISSAMIYYFKDYDTKVVSTNIFAIGIISSLVLTLACIIFLDKISKIVFKNISFDLILITIFSIIPMLANNLFSTALLGKYRIKEFNFYTWLKYFALAVFFAINVILLNMRIKGAILAILFSEIFMFIIYYKFISKDLLLPFKNALRLSFMKDAINFGFKIFIAQFLMLLAFKIDFYLINYFIGPKEVGYYSIAITMGEVLLFFPEVVGTVLFAKLMQKDKRDDIKRSNVAIVIRIILPIIFLIGILLLSLSHFIIPLIYGKNFNPSIRIAYYLIPAYFFISIYYIAFSYGNSINRAMTISKIVFSTIIIKIILSVALLKTFGLEGIAIATLASYFTACCIFIWFIAKDTKIKFFDLVLVKKVDISKLYGLIKAF